MDTIKRILLATDLTPASDRALERAVRLAHDHGAELTVLYAIRTGAVQGLLDNLPPHHIEAEMRRYVDAIPGARELAAMVVAAKGPVEQALALYAQIWKAELMVTDRPLIATVAREFLERAPCDVLIVREQPATTSEERP